MVEARSVRDTDTGTGRTVFRLPGAVWSMIEQVAHYHGLPWRDWVEEVMASYREQGITQSRASFLRAKAQAAYKVMLDDGAARTIDGLELERGAVNHPMLHGLYVLDEPPFTSELQAARVTFTIDCGGYVFHAGYRATEFGGGPVLFVEDKHRNGRHIILTQGNET